MLEHSERSAEFRSEHDDAFLFQDVNNALDHRFIPT